MWSGRGAWAQARRWAHVGRNSARMVAHEGAIRRNWGGDQARAIGASGLLALGKAQRAIAISAAQVRE
jgi:hypothetical protein